VKIQLSAYLGLLAVLVLFSLLTTAACWLVAYAAARDGERLVAAFLLLATAILCKLKD
jgi:hypothetical protein